VSARAIRPLAREDLPEVASLYEHVARSGSRTAPPGLAGYFERAFLDGPATDPEIPSLVYVDEADRVAGFLGSSVRPLRFDGRKLRMGVSGQLVTEPRIRSVAAGAFLMREYMAGPQDLTITDTASTAVRRIWEGLGGETSHLACVGWVRVFEPARFATEMRARRRNADRPGSATRAISAALDAVGSPFARGLLRTPVPTTTTEELSPGACAQYLETVAASFRLRPAYEDEAFVTWLLDEVAAVRSRGTLVARLVRGVSGAVRGWYLFYFQPGGIAQTLQVAAGEHEAGDVLDQLLHDARSLGACAIQGRVEPHLLEALAGRRCLLHPSGYVALLHSREEEIRYAIQSGRALLTRLEGEWWTGHHLEPFAEREAVARA
jgi:hypothetical protein